MADIAGPSIDPDKEKEKDKVNDGTYRGPTARDLDADGIADVDQDPETRAS